MKLSVKILKQVGACQDGIDFVVRNKLEGIDTSQIRGDYNCYKVWINILMCEIKVDGNGNLVYRRYNGENVNEYMYNENNLLVLKTCNGEPDERFYYGADNKLIQKEEVGVDLINYHYRHDGTLKYRESREGWRDYYDKRGNLVASDEPGGSWVNYQYDKNNRLIERRADTGYWKRFSYDDKGNLICRLSSHGPPVHYEYDDRGNMTKRIFEDDITLYSYEYYPCGMLHTIHDGRGELILEVKR